MRGTRRAEAPPAITRTSSSAREMEINKSSLPPPPPLLSPILRAARSASVNGNLKGECEASDVNKFLGTSAIVSEDRLTNYARYRMLQPVIALFRSMEIEVMYSPTRCDERSTRSWSTNSATSRDLHLAPPSIIDALHACPMRHRFRIYAAAR
jgi:hypothetical protein